jgi:hypothetical protein
MVQSNDIVKELKKIDKSPTRNELKV